MAGYSIYSNGVLCYNRAVKCTFHYRHDRSLCIMHSVRDFTDERSELRRDGKPCHFTKRALVKSMFINGPAKILQ